MSPNPDPSVCGMAGRDRLGATRQYVRRAPQFPASGGAADCGPARYPTGVLRVQACAGITLPRAREHGFTDSARVHPERRPGESRAEAPGVRQRRSPIPPGFHVLRALHVAFSRSSSLLYIEREGRGANAAPARPVSGKGHRSPPSRPTVPSPGQGRGAAAHREAGVRSGKELPFLLGSLSNRLA